MLFPWSSYIVFPCNQIFFWKWNFNDLFNNLLNKCCWLMELLPMLLLLRGGRVLWVTAGLAPRAGGRECWVMREGRCRYGRGAGSRGTRQWVRWDPPNRSHSWTLERAEDPPDSEAETLSPRVDDICRSAWLKNHF